jgi:hypothetical protein
MFSKKMRILNFYTVLDEQDLIVKGNLVCEKRCKGSRFKGSRFSVQKLIYYYNQTDE